MKADANISHEPASSTNTFGVSESAKQQIRAQALGATSSGSKFLDSAFLDSPRTKKIQ